MDTRLTLDERMKALLGMQKQALECLSFDQLLILALAAVQLLDETYGFKISRP